MEREDIYNLALEKYGPASQLFMVFEEMSELQKELCKAVRGKANGDHIAEEIADVKIMLAQMQILFGNSEKVEEYTSAKLKRLAERLGAE